MSTTVSGLILDEITRLGIDKIFLVPGANISAFVSQLQNRATIDIVIANHELAAGFMALGYAKATGKPGVVCCIGSPGVAYLTGAAMTAATEHIPLLCISGNIPKDGWGKGYFQDGSAQGTNDVAFFQKTIGCSRECTDASELVEALSVMTGRLGSNRPVHIQVPIDVQSTPCGEPPPSFGPVTSRAQTLSPQQTVRIDLQKKTLLLIGHEAADFIDSKLLQKAAVGHAFGIVTDIKSRGIIDEVATNAVGYIGFNSSQSALSALDAESPLTADQLLLVGLDRRLSARYIDPVMPSSEVDATTFNAWLHDLVNEKLESRGYADSHNQWLRELDQLRTYSPRNQELTGRLPYSCILDACQQVLPAGTVYCLDSGQIRRAGNMMIKARNRQTIIQSDTLSPMGMGICAAIGARAALPDRPVVALFGDGSMRMHGMELSTAKRYRLPVIFILCDNESLASTPGNDEVKRLPAAHWEKFAGSFGIQTLSSTDCDAFVEHLGTAMNSHEPTLLWTRVPDLLDDEIDILTSKPDSSWLSKFQK